VRSSFAEFGRGNGRDEAASAARVVARREAARAGPLTLVAQPDSVSADRVSQNWVLRYSCPIRLEVYSPRPKCELQSLRGRHPMVVTTRELTAIFCAGAINRVTGAIS